VKKAQLLYHEARHRGDKINVSGMIKVDRLHLPFQYKVAHDQDFDHAGFLDELEEKGTAWEAVIDDYTSLTGAEHEGVTIKACTLYPESAWDWHLVCIVEVNGEQKEIRIRYPHPGHVMPVDKLKEIIAAHGAQKAEVAANVAKHMEKLNAISNKAEAKTSGPQGPVA
jgi:hypothetical protein